MKAAFDCGPRPDGVDGSERAKPKLRMLVPFVVAVSFFMESLDSTAIATAVPQIARSLDAPPLLLSFAITSYLLSVAIFMPVSGWIADRFGARTVFCAAIGAFMLGSALCGLSTSLGMLVAMRVVQGIGGAMMTPVGRLIILRSFPKEDLVEAMSYMAVPAMIGPAIGPLVGGFFTTYISWRWIFFINLPIGLAGILLTLRLIANFSTAAVSRFDLRGFVIVGLGLATFQLTLECVGRRIVPWPVVALLAALAGVFLFVYARHARSRADPLIDLRLFRVRSFRISMTGGNLCRASIGAIPFLLPLMFQISFGFTAMKSGSLTFMAGLGAVIMRGTVPVQLKRLGFRRLLMVNATLMTLATAGLALMHRDTAAWVVTLYLLLFGFLRGTQFASITMLGFSDLGDGQMSRASGMTSVAQQFATSMGIALGASLVSIIGGSELAITAEDFRLVFMAVAAVTLMSVLGFWHLSPLDGVAMSNHRPRQADGGGGEEA